MIGQKTTKLEVLPGGGGEKDIVACEFARFHAGPEDFLVVEETTHGRTAKWRIKSVKLAERYDADWQLVCCHAEEKANQIEIFAVLVKKV